MVRRSLSDHYLLPLSMCDLCFYASLEMEASLVSPRVLRLFQAPGNRGPYPARQALLMMEKSLSHSMPHLPEIGPRSQDLGLGLPGRCCLFLLGRKRVHSRRHFSQCSQEHHRLPLNPQSSRI